MIPRKRLDIGWSDLLHGIGYCLWTGSRRPIEARLERVWSENEASLTCLSVRSGFDALLQTLGFESGTEILVSAVTIRDMTRIIEAHGLVPVPIDLDFARLDVHPESMARAMSKRTRAILVAHLFGSRMQMEPILRFAKEHNLLVIEDCAQAYSGDEYRGHYLTDVRMFSFGPIKTATALTGGILHFRDISLRNAVRLNESRWPVQSRLRFLARVCKYFLLTLVSCRAFYSVFVGLCRALRANHDRIIADRVRGFQGANFFARIRQRAPSAALALLERRLRQFDRATIDERVKLAECAIGLMRSLERPGCEAYRHTHWVHPILHEHPEQMMHHLWSKGFDATRGDSSLCVVDPPANRPEMWPEEAKHSFQRLLYLPIYLGVSTRDINRLAHVVNEYDLANTETHGDQIATGGVT